MEILGVIFMLGLGACFFFKYRREAHEDAPVGDVDREAYEGSPKGNIDRGTETVRAFVYLSALSQGRTSEEANQFANHDLVDGPTEPILAAKNFVDTRYNGRQIPMIADAKRLGMQSASPSGFLHGIMLHAHESAFDDYQTTYVSHVKQLDPEHVVNGLHWVELADDEGTRRAFNDGISPRTLAAMVVEHGPPSSAPIG